MKERIRRFLESKLPSADGLEGTVAATGLGRVQLNGGWVYDDELGFKHTDAIHTGDGINGTNTFHSHEEDGARRIVNFADRPRRIHTYGDSFTHCDQVNDGATWQEAVAARHGLLPLAIQHPLYRDIARRYIGEDVSVFRSMFMNKPAGHSTAEHGTDLQWHQDVGEGWGIDGDPFVTLWIALEDATIANGCMQIVRGSHRHGAIKKVHFPQPGSNCFTSTTRIFSTWKRKRGRQFCCTICCCTDQE